jgi:DNA-directed RNA polymerase subunit F
MTYDEVARKILERMGEKLVMRKSELIEYVKSNVKTNPKDPSNLVDSVLKMLVQKGLITPLYASESTFAITQRGMRELR